MSTPKRPRRYAQGTQVDAVKTRGEIEGLITKHGATGFIAGWQGEEARIMFEMRNRRLRFSVDLPVPSDPRFTRKGFHTVPAPQARAAYEQFKREQWRLLLLLIKSKLEAIQNNAAVFEDEMLPYTVMPNGQTVAEWLNPQLSDVLTRNTMPPLLPGARGEG